MKTYKLLNNILGWVIFAVATTVYLLTIEPTASFWDCGEFISSAYKLEVGHPPGNPIFMMASNLFTHLTSDVSRKAAMVNSMSAVASGLTILFLFWTITHLVRKLLVKKNEETVSLTRIISILACGAVGALAYTFSDTFWFSAVEGEVYASSSLMTALVFWLALKWEDVADEPNADRWLILIAYMMGLSIAIHLLNLLCIPAIVLVYYFKKYPNPNLKGSIIALLISFAILGIILFGIIQGVMKVAGWFELLFVNQFGLPYNSGVAFYMLLLVGVLVWGIWETMREKYDAVRMKIAFILGVGLLGIPFLGNQPFVGILLLAILSAGLFIYKKVNPVSLNSILIALFVILIGYSSFALIMIRSASNPPMDQNSPEDIFTLRSYLSREQYGETPLIYGPTYVSETKTENGEVVTEDEGPVWAQIAKHDPSEKDRYFVATRKERPVFISELNTLFPRMYSREANHIQGYKNWANIKGERVRVSTPGGSRVFIKPTFIENLRFFFNYQVNFMYWRYFMWNFSGRQNDIQGNGGIANGNWITGIKFLDAFRLGPQDDLPDSIVKNKGYNRFYMLPLLLGILGVFFQIYSGKKGVQGFWITFLLFFMTGLAIVVYLNQKPFEPRERDYAYAGSFYAFAIWIGLGVAAIIHILKKYAKMPAVPAAVAGAILCILVPFQMASQTWNDHDRSKRYVCRDFGYNYLTTCEPNAIIFTMGDNDTFPLWYGQEVEGYRTDVRVCNLSYLQTDWYIDQMKRQAYESAPLPISWKRTDYIQGTHDIAYIIKQTDEPMDVGRALEWIKSDDIRTKQIRGYEIDNLRTEMLYLPVDSVAAVQSGAVKPENYNKIVKNIFINLGERRDSDGEVVEPAKRFLSKQELIILDMLNNNKDWSRPIYFATTVGPENFLRLNSFLRQDGVAYRLVPYNTGMSDEFDTDSTTTAPKRLDVDTDILYDNLMHKYRWGNLEQPGLYLDENATKLAKVFRMMFGRLSYDLINEGKTEKAKEVLDYGMKVLPGYNVPYDYYSTNEIARAYFQLGETEKAREIYDVLVSNSMKSLKWFSKLNIQQYGQTLDDIRRELYYMQSMFKNYQSVNPEASQTYVSDYNNCLEQYEKYVRSRQVSRGGANR
ncbi:MAG: DUF2723 domain-containing protein [Candidatus Azobacteroides sp.]|nr:DUF2723 domain-containing protein [Candidatus Azobacteroides sp.]